MTFAGIDLHKKVIEAALIDSDGNLLARHRFPTRRDDILDFARNHFGPDTRVALEATANTWAVVGLLQPLVAEVVVSNPLRTRAIAEAKIKTDKVDALVLAQLLRCDFLPRVWIPDASTSAQRHLSTERANLVADRTRIKNRIHSILHQRLIEPPVQELFAPAAIAWLEKLDLDPPGRQALDRYLRQLSAVEKEIAEENDAMAAMAHASPEAKLLMTLPGVDFPVALTLLAVLGDISRFPSGDKAAAYLGLAPSTRQSAQHCYHGRITKQGSAHGRWMLVQAAQSLAAHPGPLGVFFRKLAKRKNRNVAVVATARKLVVIAWHMLRNNEPYRYARPATLSAKFSRLRIRATGKRKIGGFAKGTRRTATYGTGKPTRAVPSLAQVYLAQVYEDAGVPPVVPLSPGEQKMICQSGVSDFVEATRKPARVPRKPESRPQ